MPEKITATEAARRFSDILNRIRYQHVSFEIVRNGEVVARMIAAERTPSITVPEFFDLLGKHVPDASFADDLEAIQAEGQRVPDDPWNS